MMKFWPFGAAVVFLSAVQISDCSSHLLGNMGRVEGKWMAPRPGRQREPSGTQQERSYLRRQKRAREGRCLKSIKCPAGKFLKNCSCETCGDGTFTAYSNGLSECHSCEECWLDGQQVVVKECAPERDRECGCAHDYYKTKTNENDDDAHFYCNPCQNCTALNKQTKKNCSEEANAECGDCLPHFQLQEGHCLKIPDNDPRDLAYLLLCLPCLLLLWVTTTYCKKRCLSGTSSPVGVHTIVNSTCVETLLAAPGTSSSLKHKSEEPMGIPSPASPSQVQCGLLRADPSPQRSLLQGRKLYTVIDAVPVRRWKEFMRGLGLRDGEIEAVEVEHTQLREQQYEMLKRWRQQQGATVDAIFAVLEDMQLGGCAQELREQLQPSS